MVGAAKCKHSVYGCRPLLRISRFHKNEVNHHPVVDVATAINAADFKCPIRATPIAVPANVEINQQTGDTNMP